MKNKQMHLWDKIMLRKSILLNVSIICSKILHNSYMSRHRSINNFIINIVSVITAYCFFENKPKALTGYEVVKTNQLAFFGFLIPNSSIKSSGGLKTKKINVKRTGSKLMDKKRDKFGYKEVK